MLLQYTTLCRLSRGRKHNTLHLGELDYTMVRYISGITVYIRSTTSPGAIQEGGQEGDACRQEIWWSVEGSKGQCQKYARKLVMTACQGRLEGGIQEETGRSVGYDLIDHDQ